MSLELTPVGVKCNMKCSYCYEEPMRDAGNFSPGYDMDAMKAGLKQANWHFSLHGGEPMLMPINDMEEIFKYGWDNFKSNSIQTNGTLITEAHISLFKRYHVGVGISIDGPGELNDTRWMGDIDSTRKATSITEWAIKRLCGEGMTPSIIFTLYRGNAVGERLDRLCTWIEEMDALGVKYMRLHLLEIDSAKARADLSMTDDQTVVAIFTLLQLQKQLVNVRFDMFDDIAKLLVGRDFNSVTCTWNACDPYTTVAVQGVDGMGNLSNCGRTNKDGVSWGKADRAGYERQLALYHTPQDDGGCKDCRFWSACKGQCPGTAIDGDWRNRTEQCRVWFRTMERIELDLIEQGIDTVSRSPNRKAIEAAQIRGWLGGINLSVQHAIAVADGAPMPTGNNGNHEHGDHWDAPNGYQHSDGAVEVHGDEGQTTMHGDSPHVDNYDA